MYALTGTGGIGKTQLALEYAYQHETGYSAIFWVHGASASDMDLGFLNMMQAIVHQQAKITWPNGSPDYQIIGSKLGLFDCLAQDGSISNNPSHTKRINQAVHRWLSLPENSNWLFIFDNVDDLKSFKFENYIPKNSKGGRILITSRRSDFSWIAEAAEIDGLEPEAAITLLLKLASRSTNDEKGT